MDSLNIIVDSREHNPFTFAGEGYAGVSVVHKALSVGDYAIAGAEDCAAVERKSIDDLANCLGRDRERFLRQLQRGRGMDAYAVIVEAPWSDLAAGRYRSQLHPNAATATVAAIMARMRVPILFCGTRAEAEMATFQFLNQYARAVRRRLRAVEQAMDPLRPPRAVPRAVPRAKVLRMAPMEM